jgi:hypothetical protein
LEDAEKICDPSGQYICSQFTAVPRMYQDNEISLTVTFALQPGPCSKRFFFGYAKEKLINFN